MSNIGDNIRIRRRELGLTQEELATRLGYKSKTTIAKIEAGVNDLSQSKVLEFANVLRTSPAYLMNLENNTFTLSVAEESPRYNVISGVRIPVLGTVVAGIPIDAYQEILDYEDISPDLAKSGEFFALKVKGQSMSPRICEGDVLIVKQQSDVDSGEVAVILINGEEATCKKILKHDDGISLIAFNPMFEPIYFSNKDLIEKPVSIIGKVVENRQKF